MSDNLVNYIDLFVNVLSLLGIFYNLYITCMETCRQDPHRKPQIIILDEMHEKINFIHQCHIEQDALRRNSH